MTATVDPMQSDLLRLVGPVQHGENEVIAKQGRVVAQLSAVAPTLRAPDRPAWLARLAELRRPLVTIQALDREWTPRNGKSALAGAALVPIGVYSR